MDPSAPGASRWRAEQCLSVAEKLLVARDLEGCKQFSSQALAADPNTPGAEELHAAASVLLAAERHRLPNGQLDPYAVLGLDPANPASRHPDAVHFHFRRLSFLLNRSRPDRPFSPAFTSAARLVADAWSFLSDSALKSALDADLDAAAAAVAARAYHSYSPNPPLSQSSSLPARPNPPFATPSPWPTPPPAAPTPRPTPPVTPSPRPTPPPAAPSPCSTLPQAALATRQAPQPTTPVPRPTPPPVAPPPRPQSLPAASPPRSTPRAPVVSPPLPTPLPAGPQTRPTPLAPAPQTPATTMVPPAASGTPPSTTFWTICTACRHIHQYDRLYEARKLLCPSCRQSFVAEAMAEPPPIVPGTNMYYCTWGFFPYGFPGCPGFERLASSQPLGPDQLNAPWLMGNAYVKGNAGDTGVKGNAAGDAENGVPVSPAAEIPVEVPAVTPPAKPMRVKVGAKKRGRPKGSRNKKKM